MLGADASIHSWANCNTTDTLMADPLRNKENPVAVEGQIQMPQSTASAVVVTDHSDEEEYDEEAADYVSSAPLTAAVEVTDAAVVP